MANNKLPDRCELKYLVPLDEGLKFLASIKPYVIRDKHAEDEGRYHIRSVYFETTDWRFYAEKIDGLSMRRKFRLRRYLGTDVFFAEIKERVERLVRKHRVQISSEQAEAVLAGEYGCFDEIVSQGGENAEQVQQIATFLSSIEMRPMVLTDYLRYPRMGRHDPKLRVTLDVDVEGYTGHVGQSLIDGDQEAWHTAVLPRHMAILELKVTDGMPTWLAEAIHDAKLSVRAISKYCMAADLHPFCFPQPRDIPASEMVLPEASSDNGEVSKKVNVNNSTQINRKKDTVTQSAKEYIVLAASALLVIIFLVCGSAFSPNGLPWTAKARTHKLLSRVDSALKKYHTQHGEYPSANGLGIIDSNERIVDAFNGNRTTDGFSRQMGHFFMYFNETELNDIDRDGRFELYDQWKNAIRYQSDGKSYQLWSTGPDGKDNTEDDVKLAEN